MRVHINPRNDTMIRGAGSRSCWAYWLNVLAFLVMMVAGVRPVAAQHQPLRLYGPDNGLAYGAITSLTQDLGGFLYAGTENGLYRYDGSRFGLVGPAKGLPEGGVVDDVRATSDGHLWAIFSDRVYLLGSDAAVSASLESSGDDVYGQRAAVLGNDLLLVRNRHLLRVHSDPVRVLSVQPFFKDAAALDEAGQALLTAGFETVFVEHDRVWAGCGDQLCQITRDGIAVVGASAGLPADHWIALLRDGKGGLWLRSSMRIAFLAAGATRFQVVDVQDIDGDPVQDAPMLDLVEDAAGRIVTQSASGFLIYENSQWSLQRFDQNFPLLRIDRMLVDREGSLWIGTNDGQGLARLIGFGFFKSWTHAEGLSDNLVWGMTRDGLGTMWVAGDHGVDALLDRVGATTQSVVCQTARGGAETGGAGRLEPAWRSPGRAIAVATSAQGWLWIGQRDGQLLRRSPCTGRSEKVAKLTQAYMIVRDTDGVLWVGTNDGLVRVDHPDDPDVPTTAPVPDVRERVFAMTFDGAGDLWVLTDRSLFHKDRGQQWHRVLETSLTAGYMTRSMAFAPDGSLWLGSFTNGLLRLRLDHGSIVGRDTQLNEHLVSRDVEMMQADRNNRIWVGTDQGLDVTDGLHWRHFGVQDGLTVNDFDQNAAYADDDGTVWFGTSAGLSNIFNMQALFEPIKLHPVVTAIRLDGRRSSLFPTRTSGAHLHWTGDPLVVEFGAIDFRYDTSIRFRYRLRGVDPDWVETTSREVRYTNPPFGRLVFEVMAIEPNHRLASETVKVVIKMHPPWWKTWRAYVAVATLGAVALTLLWKLRVGYLIARQRLLEAEVAVRTREIEEARLILFKQATYDALTGLLNRRAIMEELRLLVQRNESGDAELAIALLDLDHFKNVNDTWGHPCGDAVLTAIGQRLLQGTRKADMAGRYGGEELLVVMPGLSRDDEERVEDLRGSVFAEPIAFGDIVIQMTGSMGVTWMQAGDDVTGMIARADAALYKAKREGRNQTVFNLEHSPSGDILDIIIK